MNINFNVYHCCTQLTPIHRIYCRKYKSQVDCEILVYVYMYIYVYAFFRPSPAKCLELPRLFHVGVHCDSLPLYSSTVPTQHSAGPSKTDLCLLFSLPFASLCLLTSTLYHVFQHHFYCLYHPFKYKELLICDNILEILHCCELWE